MIKFFCDCTGGYVLNQDTITTLIVGGAIGFLFSFLTTLLAFAFQLYRDGQTKKWELEKQKQEEGKRIITRRLETLEEKVSIAMGCINSAYLALNQVFQGHPDSEALMDFREKYFTPLANEQIKFVSATFYFPDTELKNIIHEIFPLAIKLGNFYDEMIESYRAEGVSVVMEKEPQLRELGIQIGDVFSQFQRRIDLVKIDASEQIHRITKVEKIYSDHRKSSTKKENVHSSE